MKQVLYIAYYFPPAGGPGVQRTLKFVRYLPQHGWLPTVVSVRPTSAAWPAVDASMEAEIPQEARVHRTDSWDPYAAYARLRGRSKEESVGVGFADDRPPGLFEKTARFIRANVFLPDARVGWLPHAWRQVRRCLESDRFEAIVTSGPPHSSHLLGSWASKQFAIPWLADFRDPWSEVSYYDQLPFLPWSRALDRRLERRVLEAADAVVTVSPAVGALLEAKSNRPVAVIPNGYDPADFEGVEPLKADGFSLVHTGTMTESQNAQAVWEAVAGAVARGQDVRLKLVGRTDASVRAAIVRAGLEENVEFVPYVPHRTALSHMLGADMLLLGVPRTRESSGILTGKVFEYLATGRPVLGVGPVDSDVARLVADAQAGRVFDHQDSSGIAEFIDRHYTSRHPGRPPDSDYLAAYARPALAGALAEQLNQIAAR